VFDVRICIGAS